MRRFKILNFTLVFLNFFSLSFASQKEVKSSEKQVGVVTKNKSDADKKEDNEGIISSPEIRTRIQSAQQNLNVRGMLDSGTRILADTVADLVAIVSSNQQTIGALKERMSKLEKAKQLK